MSSGAAIPRLALAPTPSARLLTSRNAWLSACALGAGAIAILLAPDRIDRADILVSGAGAPQAVASLESALRGADADLGIAATARGLALTQRLAAGLPPTLHALAVATTAAIGAAGSPLPMPSANDAAIALRASEREGAEAALARSEAELGRLSAALTDLARDQAQLLQQDGTPTPDPDNGQARKLLADLEARRIDLAARYTADFPGIAIADQEIAQLRALLAAPAKAGMAAAHAAHGSALTVLRAEQNRVGGEYVAAALRRDDSLASIRALDRTLPSPPPAPPSMVVIDLPGTTLPDDRPVPLAAMALLALLGGVLLRPRRRHAPTSSRDEIAALERAIGLPVLTCLDAHGSRLSLLPPPASLSKSLFASFSSEKEESF